MMKLLLLLLIINFAPIFQSINIARALADACTGNCDQILQSINILKIYPSTED